MTKNILHTVNKSPFNDQALASCLRLALPGSSIILIEDGVYAALPHSPLAAQLMTHTVYILEADIKARGIDQNILPGITIVDYAGFVTLTTQHELIQAWS